MCLLTLISLANAALAVFCLGSTVNLWKERKQSLTCRSKEGHYSPQHLLNRLKFSSSLVEVLDQPCFPSTSCRQMLISQPEQLHANQTSMHLIILHLNIRYPYTQISVSLTLFSLSALKLSLFWFWTGLKAAGYSPPKPFYRNWNEKNHPCTCCSRETGMSVANGHGCTFCCSQFCSWRAERL